MDIGLFSAAGSVSLYMPHYLFPGTSTIEQSSVAIALGLSLSLMSLSLLEAMPDTWMIILSHDNPNVSWDLSDHPFTLSRVYRILLWTLCVFLIVALPCMAGVSTALGINSVLEHSSKQRLTTIWLKFPWWFRFIASILKMVVTRTLYLLTCLLTVRRPARPSETGLPMSQNDSNSNGSGSIASSYDQLARYRNAILLGCIGGVTSMLVVVSSIGPVIIGINSDNSSLSMAVSWLSAIGLLISSLLNGFGSVSLPFSCLAGLFLEPIRPEAIAKADAELASVKLALEHKRKEVADLTTQLENRSNNRAGIMPRTPPSNRDSFSTKLKSRLMPQRSTSFSQNKPSDDAVAQEIIQRKLILQTEADFLQELAKDIYADISEMKYSQEMAYVARTPIGRIRSYLGIVFSVILLIRLCSAGVSIWLANTPRLPHKGPRGDIVTTALIKLTGNPIINVSQDDFTMISQIVSLSLTAILGFSQVRTFLQTIRAVNRRINRVFCTTPRKTEDDVFDSTGSISLEDSTSSFSGGVYSHGISFLMGTYFLSCIVVTKMMIPETWSTGFSAALGGMDLFTIHSSVVNSVYACSAVVSAMVLGLIFGIQRQNTIRNSSPSLASSSMHSKEKGSFGGAASSSSADNMV
jgi:hypothetical protein